MSSLQFYLIQDKVDLSHSLRNH
ncbi:hypothetical protein VCHENC02_3569, partial [Vibrio harveyi]